MRTTTARLQTPWALLWGALIVLAWAALSSLLGSDTAHAADDASDERPGLTSLVTEQVKATANTVSDAADAVVKPIAETATVVVDEVVAPAPDPVTRTIEKTVNAAAAAPVVGDPVKEAVSTTHEVTASAVAPVVAAATDAPVAHLLQPVTDAVAAVPVAGDALEDLGVLELVDRTADTVDGVLDAADPVLTQTVPEVVDALDPVRHSSDPVRHSSSVTPSSADTTSSLASEVLAVADRISVAEQPFIASPPGDMAEAMPPPSVGGSASDSTGARDAPVSPDAYAGAAGSSAGAPASALASTGIHVDPSTTRGALPDSSLPPSPAGSTDVSPD